MLLEAQTSTTATTSSEPAIAGPSRLSFNTVLGSLDSWQVKRSRMAVLSMLVFVSFGYCIEILMLDL